MRDPAASLSARKPLKDIVIDSDSDSSGLDAPPTPSRSSTRRAAPLVASPSSARKAAATPSAERKTRNSARAAASAAAAAAAEPDTEEPPTMFSDPVQWFGLVLRWLANAVNVAGRWMREHKGAVAIVVALLVAFAVAAFVDGAHRHWYREIVTWYGAWIALGFISSAGLGFVRALTHCFNAFCTALCSSCALLVLFLYFCVLFLYGFGLFCTVFVLFSYCYLSCFVLFLY